MRTSRLAQDLTGRIEKEFDILCIPTLHRTRARHWQKAKGSFSWFMFTINNGTVGSCYKAKDVWKAKKLSIYEPHLIDKNIHEIIIEEK